MRLLIADDEIESGKILQCELERQGYQVNYTASAMEIMTSIEKGAGESYEVLILNFDMPNMDGLRLLEKIREDRLDLDVIAITADGDGDKVMDAIHLGAIDYITKPISLEQLQIALFRLQQKRAAKGIVALNHRILVVDDEKGLASRMRQELEKEGYELAVAHDGVAGLEHFRANHADVVIADIRMSGIDGLEMLDQCRGINPDFISIVITGFGDYEKAVKSLRLGVFEYLRKPISLEELIGVVGKAIDLMALRRGLSARQRDLEIESAMKTRYAEKLEREKEAVEKSEEKYRSILQNIEEGYYEIDIAGYFRFFNDSFCGILGYPRDELARMNNRQNTDEENARKVYQTYNEVYLTGETLKAFDWEIIRKDGSKRHVEASISLISGPTGQPTGFKGILRDITERKQAEELYTTMANSSQVGVYIIQNSALQFVNPRFCEYTGFSEDELLGRDPLSLVHPDDTELVRCNALQLLSGESSLPYEFRGIAKNGEIRWMLETVTTIRYRGRRAVLGSHMDITVHKQAEMLLRDSEDKYRSLVNNVKLGIFRSTPGATGRFLEVNPAMEGITGYSRAELLRMDASNLYVHPEEREAILEQVASVRGKATRELLLRKNDGEQVVASLTEVVVRDDADRVLYFDGIMEDITERKILEKKLTELYEAEKRACKELEEEARARGQFINILAHEMRTPLTPMMICAGMLMDDLSCNPEDTHFRLTNNILTSARMMGCRLDELLDLARFSNGTFILEIQAMASKNFIEKTAAEFQPVVGDKNQHLVLDMPEDLPDIHADPSRMGQVLANLLSNASKFSPEGKIITLRANIEGTDLVVEIEDQGIGISPDEQERLFQPYHRVEQDRHTFSGLGLGLVISKQIVEAHGGRLWLTSELGQGSTFCFSIPVGGIESGLLDKEVIHENSDYRR